MSKAIWHEKQTLIVLLWSVLIFIGYNVLTVQADEKEEVDALRDMKFVNDDEDDYGLKHLAIEQECKDNDGQWKDNSWCKFDKDKIEDEVEFEHQLEDRGLYYYYTDKEDGSDEWNKYQQEKYEKEQENEKDSQKLLEEQEKEPEQIVEDWRNEVEPIENVKINSPFVTVPIDKDDDEKEIDEKVEKYIADYNEKEEEAVEPQDDGVVEEEPEEEEEESDDDESEDDEQEEDEPEEENSDSES